MKIILKENFTDTTGKTGTWRKGTQDAPDDLAQFLIKTNKAVKHTPAAEAETTAKNIEAIAEARTKRVNAQAAALDKRASDKKAAIERAEKAQKKGTAGPATGSAKVSEPKKQNKKK